MRERKRTYLRPDRGVAVDTLKRSVTNAYQPHRVGHGVKLSVNVHHYTSRTQCLNAALEGKTAFTKEMLEALNKKTWGVFLNNKGNPIKHESLQKHVSGMNDQMKTVVITSKDGVVTKYAGKKFKAPQYATVSYHSTIQVEGEWVSRLK
jgi:hypothetical protein